MGHKEERLNMKIYTITFFDNIIDEERNETV